MPPDTMITVMPRAAAATMAVWRAMSSRFPERKKRAPIRMPKITATKNSPRIGPPAPLRMRVIYAALSEPVAASIKVRSFHW